MGEQLGVEDVLAMITRYGTLCAAISNLAYAPQTPFIAGQKYQLEVDSRKLFGEIQDAVEKLAG